MNDNISKLYQEMLQEMRKRLDEADRIFVKMSELLVAAMAEEKFSPKRKKELLALDAKHRQLLTEVLDGVSRIYPGKIEVFPISNGDDLIAGMERRDKQMEALEKIVDTMLGCENKTQKMETNNQWRLIMENVVF